MSVDVINAISTGNPRHGAVVVMPVPAMPNRQTIDTYVSNIPSSGAVETRYTARFDDTDPSIL